MHRPSARKAALSCKQVHRLYLSWQKHADPAAMPTDDEPASQKSRQSELFTQPGSARHSVGRQAASRTAGATSTHMLQKA
mmetsp:Transcript_132145/g.232884  ORF Transcript_132145/g.232884 Transcript_132145/m.232884 type:complete len:80 (+) Transcript_132145:1282-1521(+)